MEYLSLLTFFFFNVNLVTSYSYTHNEYYPNKVQHSYCDNLSPYYGELNLDQIMGVWNGVEKISHTKGEYKIEYKRDCFYIDIKEVNIEMTPRTIYPPMSNGPYVNPNFGLTEPPRTRYLVLEWSEGIWQEKYHIKVNTAHKGFWVTDLPDNNGIEDIYRHFTGVIQVLKVANNYLVLNFCQRLPHFEQFSVIFARNEDQLTGEDLAEIHNVFTIKHLLTSTLQRVCNSGAGSLTYSVALLAIAVVLRWLMRS